MLSISKQFLFASILIWVLRCVKLQVTLNGLSSEHEEYAKFLETGSAYRITNTVCGQLLLIRPENRTGLDYYPDWRNHTARNSVLCECARYGPVPFKDGSSGFVYLRIWEHGHLTITKGRDTIGTISANKTLHLLVHYQNMPTYYEYMEDGTLKFDLVSNMTQSLLEKNRTAFFQEDFFSYVLRTMIPPQLSITFVDPLRSFWERETVNDNGVLAIVTDYSILPKPGNRTYYNALPAFNIFQTFEREIGIF